MPDTSPRGLDPDIVRTAFARFGSMRPACAWLGCSKQAIHNPNRPELRRAADEGVAEYRKAHPEEPTAIDRVRVPKALADRLALLAKQAGVSRQDYCGRVLAALETLPEPIPGGGERGDPMIPIELSVRHWRRLRALAGEGFAGRVRAALTAHVLDNM